MQFIVLGAAAGGGLPQWNCGCQNCNDARSGKIPPSGQSSLAVSASGREWSILNASPDIRQQLLLASQLHPASLRHTPVSSVLLTNGDIDHIAGLLSLREQTPFRLLATRDILNVLKDNKVFNALSADKVSREPISLEQPIMLHEGLFAQLFAVPGKVPLFMEGAEVNTNLIGEQTVGVRLSTASHVAYYIPGCAHVPDELIERLSDAEHLFFDGTLWTNNEMQDSGTGSKTGERMGHIAISGPEGSMARLQGLTMNKTYIHINNTNPVLQPGGPQRTAVQQAGWQIAYDGMEISL